MERILVASSDIETVGYDARSQTLEIAFHSGGVYQYSGVPASIYQGLMSASSHGQYFHAVIKGCAPLFRAGVSYSLGAPASSRQGIKGERLAARRQRGGDRGPAGSRRSQ